MNGTEQRNHRKVTTDLARAVEQVAHSAAQRLDSHGAQIARLEKAISDHRTHVIQLAAEQRGYVDGRDRELSVRIEDVSGDHGARIGNLMAAHTGFTCRGFWSRLNWLLTGR
jgi:hypothetical protein